MRRLVPRTRAGRVVAALVAFVVAANVLLSLLGAATPEPSGPSGSAYATQPRGLAAWAELAERSGRRVVLERETAAEAALDPSLTVVVVEPRGIDEQDGAALRRFVQGGGRLVAGGREPGRWLTAATGVAPSWAPGGGRVVGRPPGIGAPAAARLLGAVRRVVTAGEGRWERAGGGALSLLGPEERPLLLDRPRGEGRVLLLADPSPLQNRLLQRADNAALALALAGEPGRPLVFLESVHGYGQATGLAALPARWRLGLILLALAGVVLLLSRARRLGVADPEGDAPAPPRLAHVDALAAALARSSDAAGGAEGVRLAARRRVAERAGLPPGASDEEHADAARRLGATDAEAAALAAPPRTRADVRAVGNAFAAVGGQDGT